MTESLFFYAFSALAILSALMVIASKQPLYSVLYLVTAMFSLAALFALLGAYFLAVIQILIYAGAILVLFLLVLMMLDFGKEGPSMRQTLGLKVVGIVTAAAFVGEVFYILRTLTPPLPLEARGNLGTIQTIGHVLFSEHLLAFELASLIMLAAIVGAVVLSKKKWS